MTDEPDEDATDADEPHEPYDYEAAVTAMLTMRINTPAGEWLSDEDAERFATYQREAIAADGEDWAEEYMLLAMMNTAWCALINLAVLSSESESAWLQRIAIDARDVGSARTQGVPMTEDEDRIGRLVEQLVELPEAEADVLMAGVAPEDREAVQERLLLVGQREVMVKLLWDVVLNTRPPDAHAGVPGALHDAERQMAEDRSDTFRKMAWKLVLHMQGRETTEKEIRLASAHLLADDSEFRELAESTSAFLQWYGADPDAASE